MKTRRPLFVGVVIGSAAVLLPGESRAQCCLTDLFAGCRKAPPAYAVAPVAAPVMAPVMAPVPAPPPPVVVPVQQVSYVPETTYRTQYKCVPVTSYKPSCEIDPCTGCTRECVEPVTQYVQQAVNVPVTQYRAVYSTKYVQMQPGYNAAGGYAAPAAPGAAVAPMMVPPTSGTVSSPFASSVQTTPQAWGAAGADVSQQLTQPGQQSIAAPQLPPGTVVQPGFQQQIVPQSGTYAAPAPAALQPQPTAPPALSPTPSLRPIPEMQRTPAAGGNGSAGITPQYQRQSMPAYASPAPVQPPQLNAVPSQSPAAPAASGTSGAAGVNGMPVVPGTGPGSSTSAFPKLLEPTGHTTSWQPAPVMRPTAYPTAALPGRIQ